MSIIISETMKKLALVALCFVSTTIHAQTLKNIISESAPEMHFGLFSDWSALATLTDNKVDLKSGNIVGHWTTRFSPDFFYFSEITVSPDQHIGSQLAVERAFFQFNYADGVRLRVGRIHTPVSLWNTTYHHGQYLQTTISRPEVVKYSTKFSPIHSIGIELGGMLNRDAGSLEYQIGLGQREMEHHGNISGNETGHHPGAYLGGSFKPARFFGLSFGGTAYVEEREDPSHSTTISEHEELLEVVLNGHIAYESLRWNLISEVIHLKHVIDDNVFKSFGFYSQVSRRFGGPKGKSTLFARYGRLNKNENDPFFVSDNCFKWQGLTTGWRFDFAPTVAFTTEYRQFGESNLTGVRSISFQISAAL